MITKNIHISVHLEGIPVEFNSVQITERAGAPPTATISFPADSMVLTILPKTIVHIFYRDDDGKDYLIFMGELSGSGIVFTADKRMIQLAFSGITINWNTNYIIPIDTKIRNFTAPATYAQITMGSSNVDTQERISRDKFSFINIKGASLLDPIMNSLATDHLYNILRTLIDQFSINFAGIYWKVVSNALKFNNMVVVDGHNGLSLGILEIEKIVRNAAIIQHLTNMGNSMDGATPISVFLGRMLSYFGFDYTELAAPTQLGAELDSTRAHILIKPQTHYFPPLVHNLVTDDNITQLNFTRNFDSEPTRLVAHTLPWQLSSNKEATNTIFGILIPSNVKVIEGNDGIIDSEEKYQALKMFGLSAEEQCRGVIVADYQDNSGIEQAYITAVSGDTGIKPDSVDNRAAISNEMIGAKMLPYNPSFAPVNPNGYDYTGNTSTPTAITQASPAVDPKTQEDCVAKYQAMLGTIEYYNMRHAARTLSIQSPYSPYRMAGFPGVIISKYLPKEAPGMVGFLEAVTSTISADGDATQSLSFTHCRLITKEPDSPTAKMGFLNDTTINLIPWYKEYIRTDTINKFYAQFTGRNDSAVIIENADSSSVEGDIFARVKQLRSQLIAPGLDTNAIIKKLTVRPLVSKQNIQKIYPRENTRSLSQQPIADAQNMKSVLYVAERQARVNAAFNKA